MTEDDRRGYHCSRGPVISKAVQNKQEEEILEDPEALRDFIELFGKLIAEEYCAKLPKHKGGVLEQSNGNKD